MIISNSTPLIYLAKLQRLHLLQDLFKEIIIPPEVKVEVVEEGKKGGHADAFLIEQGIRERWIKVEKVTNISNFDIDLHRGEKAAISLAEGKRAKMVLIDEVHGRAAAKQLGLEPRGTIFVFLLALEQKLITFEEFLSLLSRLAREGFRLQEEVYTFAMVEAQRIAQRKR